MSVNRTARLEQDVATVCPVWGVRTRLARFVIRRALPLWSNLQPESHWAVIDERDLHVRAETTASNARVARLSLFGVEFADFRALVDSKILIG
jgi:hypothetical protein